MSSQNLSSSPFQASNQIIQRRAAVDKYARHFEQPIAVFSNAIMNRGRGYVPGLPGKHDRRRVIAAPRVREMSHGNMQLRLKVGLAAGQLFLAALRRMLRE